MIFKIIPFCIIFVGALVWYAYFSDSKVVSQNDIEIAIQAGDYSRVKYLLEHGIDVNISYSGGHTPLTLAIHAGQVRICELLISHRAAVNYTLPDGYTPLGIAVYKGNKEICDLLMKHGAAIDLQEKRIVRRSGYGYAPRQSFL